MRKMGIGLGVGINRSNYAQGIFNAYSARVVADGGVTEAGACVDAVSGLLQSASLLLIPSGYKGGKLYSEIPTNGNGDLTWTRASTALRTNSSGLLESMGSGVPRLSYMYGSCPSALLEPQRTNLATWSNDFTNAVWSKSGATITANSTTSPDGNTNASTIVFSGTDKYVTQGCLTLGTNVTTSVWIKGTSGETITVACGGTDQLFTLNGSWQRLSVNRASTTNIYTNINTFLGATARTIYVYGFQAEIGSYSTTYIPTTSATATRVADSFSRNNIYTNGLISASGGTWFVEFKNNIAMPRVSGYPTLFISSNIAGSSTLTFGISSQVSASRLSLYSWISGTFTNIGTTSTDNLKVAFAFTTTTLKVFVNGSVFASYTGLTIDPTTIQNLIGNAEVTMFIQQMALFNSALTDTQLTQLTT